MSPVADPAPRTPVAERVVAWLGLCALVVGVLDVGTMPLRNGDIFWQVRTGDLARATGVFPDTDPFSYTVAGAPWNNHEWLFEWFASVLQGAFGWGALRFLGGVVCAAVLTGVFVVVRRKAGTAWGLFVASLAFPLLGYKFLPAPQTVSMAAFFAAFHLLRTRRPFDSAGGGLAFAGGMLAWGNVTAEVVAFLPFLAFEAGSRLWQARGDPSARVPVRVAVLGVALLAPFVNPPWSSTLEYALAGTGTNRDVNVEFRGLFAPAATVEPLVKGTAVLIVVLALAWAAWTLLRRRDASTLRRVVPVLGALAGAVLMERNLWLLVLPVARLAVDAAPRLGSPARVLASVAGPSFALAWLLALGWKPVALGRLASASTWTVHVDDAAVPVSCTDAVARLDPDANVFTVRVWASWVIWRLPDAKVFIDGRNREYPIEVFEAAQAAWTGLPGTLGILDASGTDVVVATPDWGDRPGVRGGPWRRTFSDRACAVFTRAPDGTRERPR